MSTDQWHHIDGFSKPYDWCCAADATPSQFTVSETATESELRQLYFRIQRYVESKGQTCIVVDDISALALSFGIPSTLLFLRYCRYLAATTKVLQYFYNAQIL